MSTSKQILPSHISQLSKQVAGVGPITLSKLAEAFPKPEDLKAATEAATEADFAAVVRVKKTATALHQFLNGNYSQTVAGKKRVWVWNTKTMKLIKGRWAPTEDEIDDFLLKFPEYKLYARQELEIMSPTSVPAKATLTETAYLALKFATGPEAEALAYERVKSLAFDHGLIPSVLDKATGKATGLLDALCSRVCGALVDPRTEAAMSLSVPRDQLDAHVLALQANTGIGAQRALQQAYATMARSAHEANRLPIWIMTPFDRVFVVGGAGAEGGLPPVRVGQIGRGNFIPLFEPKSEPSGEPSGTGAFAANGQAAELIDVESVPQFKDELKTMLSDLERFLGEVKQTLPESTEIDQATTAVRELMGRAESVSGRNTVLLGNNGIGKSTLGNAVLLCSGEGDQGYAKGVEAAAEYQLEGLLNLYPERDVNSQQLPTLRDLRAPGDEGEGARKQWRVEVEHLKPGHEELAREMDSSRMTRLREHALSRAREAVNPFRNFLLPCGNVNSATTSLALSVRYGKVVHVTVEFRDLRELQSLAFEYVVLRRSKETDRDDGDDIQLAYATYMMITTGKRTEKLDYSPGEDADENLPESPDAVKVCTQLMRTAELKSTVFLGPGSSLVGDRLAMHNKLNDFMAHEDGACALAYRRVVIYYPSVMLEGGGCLVDLPGLDASSVIEQVESRDGVTSSSTGVVVVVVAKSIGATETTQKKLKEFGVTRHALSGCKHVIFAYNREKENQGLLVADLPEAEWDALERKDRAMWKKLLENEQRTMNKTPGEQHVDDDAINEVVKRTTFLPVYPMLHLSAMLNVLDLPADADKADKHSGILQLIGSIDALNYQALLDDIEKLCTHALPKLSLSLQATLTDAACELPQELVDLAHKMLGKRRTEAFTLPLDQLKQDVERKFNEARNELIKSTSDFLRSSESIYEPLCSARIAQQRSWQELQRRIEGSRFDKVSKLIAPLNSGMLHGLELMPVAFPAPNVGASVFDKLTCEIESSNLNLVETVTQLVVDKVQELLKSSGTVTNPSTDRQLMQTVHDHKIDGPLQVRASAFFSAKQQPIELQRNQPGQHIMKTVQKVSG